jgi:amidase
VKIVNRDRTIYTFSKKHRPVTRVEVGELVIIKTEDAFGGQIRSEEDSVQTLDWGKIDGATGPIFVEGAEPGDTLVVEIVDITVPRKGVIVTVPEHGVLADRSIKPSTKTIRISKENAEFEDIDLRIKPMIGTIGVTPSEGEISCGSLGRHGGNMDVKEMTLGSKLYLPVFANGALFAAGDVHAVQADGELCVSAIEVPGEISLKFNVVKGRKPEWPVLETDDSFAILTSGETLDEAAKFAAEAAVEALMRQHHWSFETAYMFGSLAVDLKINQVVDPKKGVRAVISKKFIDLDGFLMRS